MDIFKFNSPIAPTKLEQGEIINGLKSKMWVERYSQAGEFKLVANVSTGLRESLPIGSFISHVDTPEIMIVENHEISQRSEGEPEITITGRGFETYFSNRIVGSNKAFPTSNGITDFSLAADETWDQAVTLINEHILESELLDPDDAIPYVQVITDVTGTGTVAARALKRGDLYTRLLEILNVDLLGIKAYRPGAWSPLAPGSPDIAVLIHVSEDKSSEVIFSHQSGEIENADYLWSNRKEKNAVIVSGRWVEIMLIGTETEYSRRVMHVEASDIDNSYTVAPTGQDLTDVINLMEQRGLEALASQIDLSLTKAEVSRENQSSVYRVDYNVGDIITVHGDYNESSLFMVAEYVEIEDQNGKIGYPTLSVV